MASANVVQRSNTGQWQNYAAKFLRDLVGQSMEAQEREKQRQFQEGLLEKEAHLRTEGTKDATAYAAEAQRIAEERQAGSQRIREQEAIEAFRKSLGDIHGGGQGQPQQQPSMLNVLPQGVPGSQQPPANPFTGGLPAMQPQQPPVAPAAQGGDPQLNTEQKAAFAIFVAAVKGGPAAAQVASDFVTRGLLPPDQAQKALQTGLGIRTSANVERQAGVQEEGFGVQRRGQDIQEGLGKEGLEIDRGNLGLRGREVSLAESMAKPGSGAQKPANARQLAQAAAAFKMLDQFEDTVREFNEASPVKDPTEWNRKRIALSSLRQSLAIPVARAMGEVGNLSQPEQEAARALINPGMDWTIIDPETAFRQIDIARSILTKINEGAGGGAGVGASKAVTRTELGRMGMTEADAEDAGYVVVD